jgi:DNA-binding MarR family transcriptional regulator/N-acetylglutamate synthase-like GNAT family acetyltransferase
MDLIKQLGPLAFASRLKRLSERLHKDGSRIYDAQAADFEARWFPVLYALKLKSRQPVTTIASDLGLTHPAINQIAGVMEKRGIITSTKDKKDERKRLLRLTPKGRKLIKQLEPVWKIIEEETAKLIRDSGGQVLKSIDRIEKELDEKDMYERVMQRLHKSQIEKVQILDYRPQYKKYFKSLNYEWLKKYFRVEPTDEMILSDPAKHVIKPGGFIIFAKFEGAIVGTAAVMKHDSDTFELTKMAVTRKAQGMQIGQKLGLAAIRKAKKLGAKSLILHTSPKLKTAISIYEKLGFKRVDLENPDWPKYRRRTFVMELKL